MPKKETGLRAKGQTNVLSLIRKLDEIIHTTENTRKTASKSVIELSEMLRDAGRSKADESSLAVKETSITLDRFLKAGRMIEKTQELFLDLRTELKNNIS